MAGTGVSIASTVPIYQTIKWFGIYFNGGHRMDTSFLILAALDDPMNIMGRVTLKQSLGEDWLIMAEIRTSIHLIG